MIKARDSASAVDFTDLSRRRTKTSVLVAQALADHVRELEPGTMLPPERELVERFGVARSTVREALRLLELQGLLTIKAGAGGGPVVSQPDHRPLADTLSLALQASEVTFADVVQARKFVEADLARLATQNVTEEDIATLREFLETMSTAKDEEAYLEENLRFHEAIAAAARSRVLELFHASLRAISDGQVIGVTYSRRRRLAVNKAHGRIVDAIAARDGDEAYAAAWDHMAEFETYLGKHYSGLLDRPVRWTIDQS